MTETAKDNLKKREKLLNDYENNMGLPSLNLFQADDELKTYFIMDRHAIEKLDAYNCSIIAFRLSQYAFQMQRYINREKAICTYAESNLKSIVAQHSGDYDKYTKHEVKVENVCKENSAANEWKKIYLYAKQRSQRLEDLSRSIDNLAYRISMVQKHKENK